MIPAIGSLSAQQLLRAAKIKGKIESLQTRLEKVLGFATASISDGPSRQKRKMSASARRKIGLAQKARWAKQKAAKLS